MNEFIKLIILILFIIIILTYYFDVIITLTLDPMKFIENEKFLNKLSKFHEWKSNLKLFKKLPSAKEK